MALVKRADFARFQDYIEAGDYVLAIKLAESCGFDKDDVYKRQWSAFGVGTEVIRDVLSRVQDAMWVVKECKDRVCPSFEAMNSLLSCGLRLTERYSVYSENGISSLEERTAIDRAWWFRFKRLRLLEYKEKLDTFVGINNGRYSQNEYGTFRSATLHNVALGLAERGKTGALSVLFQRHTYSLAPYILQLLDAIPESLPPQTYGHFLPDISPPKPLLLRKIEDWVEKDETLKAVKGFEKGVSPGDELSLDNSTEYMVKLSRGLLWPTKADLIDWYKERAKEIDKSSGLLENSLSLLDLGVSKGLRDLETYFEDVSDLYGLLFSSNSINGEVELRLSDWDVLSKYEKFKLILDGTNEKTAVDRLLEQAVPFMIRNEWPTSPVSKEEDVNDEGTGNDTGNDSESFLVRWLKETAKENKLSICSAILAECCREQRNCRLLSSDEELVEVVLFCIYACSQRDEWTLMSSMLARLPQREVRCKEMNMTVEDVQGANSLRKDFIKAFRGAVSGKSGDLQLAGASLYPRSSYVHGNYSSETVEERVRLAKGHVEAGQLLLQYQVPKPICFFLSCKEDINGTKQLLRILLLKFSNRDPAKSDSGWALLWRDLLTLQENAFPFLDKEYLLSELCQGILKAGKFSLAKTYLKGTGTTILRTEKAEKLVLDAAREYFYSAPDLDSSSVGKAKQCLCLLSPSTRLTTEMNLIEAITERLPALGVTLLPVQFRQLKNSMEVVKLTISSGPGAYLNIPEMMELARLLGLSSLDDISAIEAAIAEEAIRAADFGLALDMCLGLVKKGHGPVWDLCATLGRGPDFEQMNLDNHKVLLGFALGHSDVDSVEELLSAWKESDLMSACDIFGRMVGKSAVKVKHERLDSQHDLVSSSGNVLVDSLQLGGRQALPSNVSNYNKKIEQSWPSFVTEKTKGLGFVCLQLPWLLEISSGKSQDKVKQVDIRCEDGIGGLWIDNLPKEYGSRSAQAALILQALATSNVVADDNLVLRLAKEAMERPVSSEGDTVGCGYLLNLGNAHLGAELLETKLQTRENYEEVHQALELALSFSTLQESVSSMRSPKGRRDILIQTLRARKATNVGDSSEGGPVSNFWRGFSTRAVETLRVAEESRRLRKVFPDVDVGRFLLRDEAYILEKILSLVDSVKMQEEKLLPKLVALADQYNVEQWQIFEKYFLALLGADETSEEEIATEITGYWARLLICSDRLVDTIEIYEQVASTALEGLWKEGFTPSSEAAAVTRYKRTLVRILVSLGSDAASLIGEASSSDIPELNLSDLLCTVRYSVWQKLCKFAEDLQAPLHSRIFILELLESIRNGKVSRQDFWCSGTLQTEELVICWREWDAEGGNLEPLKQQEVVREEKSIGSPVNVLVALRSTHIISSHWLGLEVTSRDLSSYEAAASFFGHLLEGTSSFGHAKVLKALLEEWESVFGFVDRQGEESKDLTVKEDEKEDWSEGWDEFSESNWAVHTLHVCWKATLQKLTEFGGLREALGVLDAALLHPTSVLVTEGEAMDLVAAIGLSNPCAALQLSLLLPYTPSKVHGLQLLEEKLTYDRSGEQAGVIGRKKECILQPMPQGSDCGTQDLMALVLSSGMLPSTVDDPSLPMVFSYLCGFLGHLALQKQELQLSRRPSLKECLVSVDNVPFCAVAFPFFIAELTKSKHYGQAGALVLQFMRVHPALATWSAAFMALERYLTTQAGGVSLESISMRENSFVINQGNVLQLDHLRNTVHSLTCRLEEVLKFASTGLCRDSK